MKYRWWVLCRWCWSGNGRRGSVRVECSPKGRTAKRRDWHFPQRDSASEVATPQPPLLAFPLHWTSVQPEQRDALPMASCSREEKNLNAGKGSLKPEATTWVKTNVLVLTQPVRLGLRCSGLELEQGPACLRLEGDAVKLLSCCFASSLGEFAKGALSCGASTTTGGTMARWMVISVEALGSHSMMPSPFKLAQNRPFIRSTSLFTLITVRKVFGSP